MLILQHPLEVSQAKGTARLLHLSMAGSRLMVGEAFDQQALASTGMRDMLLYPRDPGGTAGIEDAAEPVGLSSAWRLPDDNAQLRLIVLDGTWRKSRKMLYLNPWLQRLPRLALEDQPASRYRIRKAQRPGQLSTLEATCAALAQLEDNPAKYAPLLQAFEGFIAQQHQPVLRSPAAIPLIEM